MTTGTCASDCLVSISAPDCLQHCDTSYLRPSWKLRCSLVFRGEIKFSLRSTTQVTPAWSLLSDDTEIESVLSPSLSAARYDNRIWSLSQSFSSLASSDVGTDDEMISGLGLTSGRIINAVGKAEINAVQWLWTRYRRAVIKWSLMREMQTGRFKRGTERMLDDLIEFNRQVLYIRVVCTSSISDVTCCM